jgi:hypothetical protein
MPLNTHFLTADELLPENLNFRVEFEPTSASRLHVTTHGLWLTCPCPK